jgi:DNA-directed RNA polymerase subunit RPC12/RpoP
MAYRETRCENCGVGFIEDPEIGCKKCGYKIIPSREGDTFDMYFCEECGITYSSGACVVHIKKKK